ncbi:YoaK family protein [Rhodopila sp.]|uniref:YoaK family protein n=1 Tax=Rhodopila sp. TaxID=2480087 RepID=UPI003D118DFC
MTERPPPNSGGQEADRHARGWSTIHPSARFLIAVTAACLLTAAGGMLDVWVYLTHGHVFANAQTGNIVLFAIGLAAGHTVEALRHVPSMTAFVVGLLLSRTTGTMLKRSGRNSRAIRLSVECVLLVALAGVADRLSDHVVTACVGFLAAVQITTLSHIGDWSFNTGMTTGNLLGAVSAFSQACFDPRSKPHWFHTLALGWICVAFALGAILGGYLAPRWHGATLIAVAGLVLGANVISFRAPDPLSLDDDGR